MPDTTFEIVNYKFQMQTTALRQATVSCYDQTGLRGWLSFDEDSDPPGLPVQDENLRVNLYFKMSQFETVMELLRTEKPIYVYYHSATHAGLTSGKEPTGEEET